MYTTLGLEGFGSSSLCFWDTLASLGRPYIPSCTNHPLSIATYETHQTRADGRSTFRCDMISASGALAPAVALAATSLSIYLLGALVKSSWQLGAACHEGKLETPPASTVSSSLSSSLQQGPTVGPTVAGSILRTTPPATVFVVSFPKTGSTTMVVRLSKWLHEHVDPDATVERCHMSDCSELEHLNCTASRWCLFVSGVRRNGEQVVSWYFQSKCGKTEIEPKCKEAVKMSEQDMLKDMLKFMRTKEAPMRNWWMDTLRAFRKIGLGFQMDEMLKDGVSELPEASWVILPFEWSVQEREEKLGKWMPNVNLSWDGMSHKKRVYSSQLGRMVQILNSSQGPRITAARAKLLLQDTMLFFYKDRGLAA